MFERHSASGQSSERGVLPEPRALRVLFYRPGTFLILLIFWSTISTAFLVLMTYKSLHPLGETELGVALAFGALISLTLMLGWKAQELTAACAAPRVRNASVIPATLVSVLAALATCMCCLPVIPMVLGVVLSGTALASQVLPITLGIIQWSPELYLASGALLVWSLHRNAHTLLRAVDAT